MMPYQALFSHSGLWTLVNNGEFFQISSAMMHVIIVGWSGAIAMNLTVCKKQVEIYIKLLRIYKPGNLPTYL